MFCGDPGSTGYESCTDQVALFALASLLPAALAVALMVAAFTLPTVRHNTTLRSVTLRYSLVAWGAAGFVYIMGILPSV